MDSGSRESLDIRQWIRRVQEDSENDAERHYVDAKNTSLLKKAERERLSQDIDFLKQKYFPQDDESHNDDLQNHSQEPHTKTPTKTSTKTPTKTPTKPDTKIHAPLFYPPASLPHSTSYPSTNKTDDVYKNSYTKYGKRPPDLDEWAQYGVGHPDLATHARAQNARDLQLLDFDHPPSESDWMRKFGNKVRQEPKSETRPHIESPRKSSPRKEIQRSESSKKESPRHEHTKVESRIKESPRKESPRHELTKLESRTSESPKKTSPRVENIKEEIRKRESPKKEISRPKADKAEPGLELVANFDPLAIEAHSLLHNWVAVTELEQREGDPSNHTPPSRWQQLRAGIQNLDKPSMLLPAPPAPHSLAHHTASSKMKVISDTKEEKKPVKATPSPPHDPRPNMEMRHENVHQMGKRRAEMRVESARKKKAEEEKRESEKREEEVKRLEEKRHKEKYEKQMEAEANKIKSKREEEAQLVREEELKILEAHKLEVQKKIRAEREQIELEEARRIEEIKREEERKRHEMKISRQEELAKTHADRKILQKCLSTWFLHVRELKLKLDKFKMVRDWKVVNGAFKTWRRFAQNSKAEREANQFASRAKEDQRNLDRAIKFRDYRVTLKCFLIWVSRAKLKGEERQTQHQHELRKQQMAQFLLKAKQLPNVEAPAPPSPTSPTAKTAKPGAKKPAPQKGSPNPAQKGNPGATPNPTTISPRGRLGPNSSPNPSNISPRSKPSPRNRPGPSPAADTSSPVSAGKSENGEGTKKEEEAYQKDYTPPGVSRAYLEMESRAEQRKNRRKELELKYQEAQRQKEQKLKEEEEKERQRLEAEKQAKLEQKRLAKQKEAADRRRKEIEEKSEKLAISHDGKRLLKFYCWLPWRKYMAMHQAKSDAANAHFERKLISKITRIWREITERQIEEKLKFADEFYVEGLQQRTWDAWKEALHVSRARTVQADAFCGTQIQKRHFLIWFRLARLALDRHEAEELRKELEMEKYYSYAVVRKTWRAWKRYVILEKGERKSEKRKEDLRQKAQGWLQQYRQEKSSS